MIMNYNTFSGLFSVDLDEDKMTFRLSYDIEEEPFRIYLLLDDDIYDELSVIIPDSDELYNGEFFMDSKIDTNIIEELISQGFIVKTNKTSIAGEDEVISYKINI
jgi:hypothetical protein